MSYEGKFDEGKQDDGAAAAAADGGSDASARAIRVTSLSCDCNGEFLPITQGFAIDIGFEVLKGHRIMGGTWEVEWRWDAMDASKVISLGGDQEGGKGQGAGGFDYEAGNQLFRHKSPDLDLARMGVNLRVFRNIMGIVVACLKDGKGAKVLEVNFVVQTRRRKVAAQDGKDGGKEVEEASHVARSKGGSHLYIYERMLIVPDIEES